MPSDQITFAEASLLQLDRAVRQLEAVRESLRAADEQLNEAYMLSQEDRYPPTLKIINENVQSISISLVNTNDGLALKVGHRGSDLDHLVQPSGMVELKLNGE